MTTDHGATPSETFVRTVLVAVFTTDTELAEKLATEARVPSGETATDLGLAPTAMVPVTVLVAVLITDTALLLQLGA
jgi:hypothetical protein